jgi:hypothetical protein
MVNASGKWSFPLPYSPDAADPSFFIDVQNFFVKCVSRKISEDYFEQRNFPTR